MMSPEERERLEEIEATKAVGMISRSSEGQKFLKHLFRTLAVGEVPMRGMSGEELHDFVGFLRAGRAVFNLVAKANPQVAGDLMATIERERNVFEEE